MQDDLGLNWVQFKYRMHDPAIGRFMVVDPLAEDYLYNSPYAFSENKVISHFELEGLEAQSALAGLKATGNFLSGLANAVASNNTTLTNASGQSISLVPRSNSSAPGFSAGQTVGDVVSAIQGGVEIIAGLATTAAGGTVEVVTLGAASPVALPAVAVGAAAATHGANTGANALSNLLGDNNGRVNAKGKSKTTTEKQQNLDNATKKGIPKSQLGPSGKPKIHNPKKPNLKSAKDAARNNPKSNSSPVKHSSDSGQKTHFHSTRNGKKTTGKDNVHFVDRSSKKNQ